MSLLLLHHPSLNVEKHHRKEWSSLSHGIRTIQATMTPYKENSAFINLIEEQDVIPDNLQPLPPTSTESPHPTHEDMSALDELLRHLEDVKHYIRGHEEEENLLDQIIKFAMMLKGKIPMTSTSEQFEASRMLRIALITVPNSLLSRIRREPRTIVVAAYFYTSALAVQPLFPAMGAMVFPPSFLLLSPLPPVPPYSLSNNTPSSSVT
jgi:hypothetical protein